MMMSMMTIFKVESTLLIYIQVDVSIYHFIMGHPVFILSLTFNIKNAEKC